MASYNGKEETVAYELKLSQKELTNLFDQLRADYALTPGGNGLKKKSKYHHVFYNCAHYTCDQIADAMEGLHGVLVEQTTVTATPVFTNQGILMLQALGVLGFSPAELKAPEGAPRNVIIYWKYNPPKE